MSCYNKQVWEVIPKSLPVVKRNCSGCGRKTTFINSRKFRINANKGKLDIWMIFQCENCKKTWNMTLYERLNKNEMIPEIYQKLMENDLDLISKYAFTLSHYQANKAAPEIDLVEFEVVKTITPLHDVEAEMILIKSPQMLSLRLDKFLAEQLTVSRSQIQKEIKNGNLYFENSNLTEKIKYLSGEITIHRK